MDLKRLCKNIWVWRKNEYWGWVESFFLTLGVLLLCKLLYPSNPLFVKEPFSWPWIASIIIVFQYGFGPGIFSVLVISLLCLYYKNSATITVPDFQNYLMTGTMLVLICGLFSSNLVRRLINMESLYAYTEERLRSLSRSYYALRISSDYLEQNMITKPLTMRMAIEKLTKLSLGQDDRLSYEAAHAFLQIITQFCTITVLGIYLTNKNNRLDTKPFVEIGSMGELLLDDPLIKEAMKGRDLCFVTIRQIETANQCNYLIAMPMTAGKKCFGLLVIKEMPFWSLNRDIVKVLSVLAYYFVAEMIVQPEVKEFLSIYPSCSRGFSEQLNRLIALRKDRDVQSAMAAFLVHKSIQQHNILFNLTHRVRVLDSYFFLELGEYDVFITLLPFTDAAGLQGYVQRMQRYIYTDLGILPDVDKIKIRSLQLYGDNAITFMNNFLQFIEGKSLAE